MTDEEKKELYARGLRILANVAVPRRIETRFYLIERKRQSPFKDDIWLYLDNGDTHERIDIVKMHSFEATVNFMQYLGLELGKKYGNKASLARLNWYTYKATFTDVENVPDKIEFWKEQENEQK